MSGMQTPEKSLLTVHSESAAASASFSHAVMLCGVGADAGFAAH